MQQAQVYAALKSQITRHMRGTFCSQHRDVYSQDFASVPYSHPSYLVLSQKVLLNLGYFESSHIPVQMLMSSTTTAEEI